MLQYFYNGFSTVWVNIKIIKNRGCDCPFKAGAVKVEKYCKTKLFEKNFLTETKYFSDYTLQSGRVNQEFSVFYSH
jgi:hypothetical protein